MLHFRRFYACYLGLQQTLKTVSHQLNANGGKLTR